MLQRSLLRATTVTCAVGLWWLLTATIWSTNPVLSRIGPFDAVPSLIDTLSSSSGWSNIQTSLTRLLAGLFIAVVIGVPLGILLGTFRKVEEASTPIVNFLRMISPLAWAPMVIVAFGVGTAPVVFLIAITAVWPMVLGSAAGVKALDPGWRDVARSLGAQPREVVRSVVVPGVRAHVLTALRLALGVAWVVLVPAEMLGVDSGLGFAVLNARDQLDYAALGGNVLLIGCIGYILDGLFRRLA
jgi:NitT/TauT family transport system permease protein